MFSFHSMRFWRHSLYCGVSLYFFQRTLHFLLFFLAFSPYFFLFESLNLCHSFNALLTFSMPFSCLNTICGVLHRDRLKRKYDLRWYHRHKSRKHIHRQILDGFGYIGILTWSHRNGCHDGWVLCLKLEVSRVETFNVNKCFLTCIFEDRMLL